MTVIAQHINNRKRCDNSFCYPTLILSLNAYMDNDNALTCIIIKIIIFFIIYASFVEWKA